MPPPRDPTPPHPYFTEILPPTPYIYFKRYVTLINDANIDFKNMNVPILATKLVDRFKLVF